MYALYNAWLKNNQPSGRLSLLKQPSPGKTFVLMGTARDTIYDRV